jgi:hypothetical protein
MVRNNTTIFLLPILNMIGSKDFIINSNFISAYIYDIDKPEYDEKLLLAYTKTNIDTKFEKILQNSLLFKDSYIDKENKIFVFDTNDFLPDYEKFLLGYYDEFSINLKSNIYDFWNLTEKDNLYKIIQRIDIWPKPIIFKEVYNFKYY